MARLSPRRVLGSTLPRPRDYYPTIAYAVSKLDKNTAEGRYALFERAKSLVVEELRGRRPPATEPEIVRECSALRAAIRKVESELEVNEILLAPRSWKPSWRRKLIAALLSAVTWKSPGALRQPLRRGRGL